MTKKEIFINEIKSLMVEPMEKVLSKDALDYFNSLQATEDKSAKKFTENGKIILRYMQENKDNYNNLFKAKDIGEGLGISSRTVSGAMRKLVTDGYVEKMGDSPSLYSITSEGIGVDLDNE